MHPQSDGSAAFVDVTKSFGGVPAVDGLDLSIEGGEFFTLLGPSGCGKTTTLRILGGFAVPDHGAVFLGGQDVTFVPPYRRDTNTVFQSYALFEHLTVAGNVAFGLRRQRVSKAEIRGRVSEMLEMVGLLDRADALPRQLSGGQKQRVALARSLVNLPKVLLLDEPLAALDLQLRRQMQLELKRIQREVGITFVFVTHDQEEALVMSDRIAVLNSGRLEQVGEPEAIYDRPQTTFVAQFIGKTNMLRGRIQGDKVELDSGQMIPLPPGSSFPAGARVCLSVRPENLVLTEPEVASDLATVTLEGWLADRYYHGATTHYLVDIGDGNQLQVASIRGGETTEPRPGTAVAVRFKIEETVALPDELPN